LVSASAYTVRFVDQTLPFYEHREAWRTVLEDNGFDYASRCVIADLAEVSPTPSRVVVEGIRTWEDIQLLKQHFTVKVIGIWRSLESAYEYALQRGRDDAPHSLEEYIRGAAFEYSLGLGRIFYAADQIVVNRGDLEQLKLELLQRIEQL
jgi:hypothetical protein